jgi:uncharacterized repeat protein (TIGR01451 family)
MSKRTVRAGAVRSAGVLCALALSLLFASPVLAASPPTWELISSHTPADIPLSQAANQVDTVTVEGGGVTPYVGRFALEVETEAGGKGETRPLRYASSASAVQAALEAVPAIGPGNVRVTGGPKAPGGKGQSSWSYVVTFTGALRGREVGLEEEELTATGAEEAAAEKAGVVPEEAVAEVEVMTSGTHDTVTYELTAVNTGGSPSSGKITVTDTLPAGLSTESTPQGQGWACSPPGEGRTTVTCTSEAVVQPGAKSAPITIGAYVDIAHGTVGEQLVNTITITGGGAGATTKSDAATTVTAPTPTGPRLGLAGGRAKTLTSKQIAAVLGRHLVPSGSAARIPALLSRGGYKLSVKALEASTVVIGWYQVPAGAKLASKAKPVLVAAGKRSFSAAGTAQITIKLTGAGRRLLSHARKVTLTAKGTLTPSSKVPITARRSFVLAR